MENNEKVLLQVLSKKDGVIILGYTDTKEPCIRLHTKANWDSIPIGQCALIPLSSMPEPKFSDIGDILNKYINAKI
jgi:hypothetical protein